MELTCYVFPDLMPWERACVEPIVAELAKAGTVRTEEVGEHHKGILAKRKNQGVTWILSRDWQAAAKFLSASKARGTVWISVFDSSFPPKPLIGILYRKLFSSLPSNLQLLVHSPLALRFFLEVAGVAEHQVHHVPLALPTVTAPPRKSEQPFTIGAFGALHSDNNFHSVLLLAHYIFQRQADIRFRIFGLGPLYEHLGNLVRALGLQSVVNIVESIDISEWNALDTVIYTPRKNDHFAELLIAGRLGLPVLASDVPGTDAFIQDSRTGFISAIHETKPMAELALRLSQDATLRQNIGRNFQAALQAKFSGPEISAAYSGLFFASRYTYKNFRRAA